MGIFYPICDRTRQIRMIYYTLYQRELGRCQKHTLRPFHPLSASGSINFLDSTKTKNLSAETRWNSSLLAWKHYYLGSHSVLSQLPLSCWRERDGICWLALCKLQNVFPRSFAQCAYRFQCFLLNQVRPSLNVLIFIFWSFTLLRERSGLAPFKKSLPISEDVWCYFTTHFIMR